MSSNEFLITATTFVAIVAFFINRHDKRKQTKKTKK